MFQQNHYQIKHRYENEQNIIKTKNYDVIIMKDKT